MLVRLLIVDFSRRVVFKSFNNSKRVVKIEILKTMTMCVFWIDFFVTAKVRSQAGLALSQLH